MAIFSFSPFGFEGSIVNVEVDLRHGIPAFDIVGLADSIVSESRERIRTAFKRQEIDFPSERVLLSLSPPDLRKDSPFDLPIALEILHQMNRKRLEDAVLVMGELEYSGTVRPIRAVGAALQTAVAHTIKYAIIPNDPSIVIPKGIKVLKVNTLKEGLKGLCELINHQYDSFIDYNTDTTDKSEIEFSDIDYKETLDSIHSTDSMPCIDDLKYAMTVAVAGRHNILAYGGPGCGKTLVLQRMTEIMPKLSSYEAESVNRIYSLAGFDSVNMKDRARPFRMPYQTASIEGVCGGGIHCRPGEISLAHNGVLFLDETAEFRTSVLQMLRIPLESNQITLLRAGRTTVFPARFQLVMAANPCPCGNYGSKNKICLCSARTIEQYWKKFSAPLLDRVAIRFSCNDVHGYPSYSLEQMRDMVKRAWERQYARQGKLNNDLTSDEVMNLKISKDAEYKLDMASQQYDLSPRAVANIKRLARTIADIHAPDSAEIEVSHIAEALTLSKRTPLETAPSI